MPLIIHQMAKPSFAALPDGTRSAALSWAILNPEWTYKYYDDHACDRAVERYGARFANFTAAYDTLLVGAARSDLLRLLLLHEEGGVYSDVDTAAKEPLRAIVRRADLGAGCALFGRHDLCDDPGPCVFQWWLAAAPRHPTVRRALERAVAEVLRLGSERVHRRIERATGTVQLWRALEDSLVHVDGLRRASPRAGRAPNGVFYCRRALAPGGVPCRARVIGTARFTDAVLEKYAGYHGDVGDGYWKAQVARLERGGDAAVARGAAQRQALRLQHRGANWRKATP